MGAFVNMKRVAKIRFYPNETQKQVINKTLDACNFVFNKYLEANLKNFNEAKEKGEECEFISAYTWKKELTILKQNDENYKWLVGLSTKAVGEAIITAEKAYKAFFKGLRKRPNFKSKKRNNLLNSYFFEKVGINFFEGNESKKNKIKIPILGEVRITRKEQLPSKNAISSGRILKDCNDKYFLTFTYDIAEYQDDRPYTPGIKVKVGMEDYATIYDEEDNVIKSYPSFLLDERYKKLDERVYMFQCIIFKKGSISLEKEIEDYKASHDGEEPNEKYVEILKGRCFNSSNIQKVRKKLNLAHTRRVNYSTDFINKTVFDIVRDKPEYIIFYGLEETEGIDNEDILKSCFFKFKTKLQNKCEYMGIEFREDNKVVNEEEE